MPWFDWFKGSGKQWWDAYGSRLILALAFLLVGVLSFEAGLLQQRLSAPPEPVIIRVAEPASLPQPKTITGKENAATVVRETQTLPETQASCALVGSKNSNKYHHPATRCAKQIKPANKVCFASVEDAKAKGYIAGCLE